MTFVRTKPLADVWPGELCAARAGEREIVLWREGERVHAFIDACAHLGLPVSDGELAGGRITCAQHGWCYDARTGAGINPRRAALTALPVRVERGEIWVGDPGDQP